MPIHPVYPRPLSPHLQVYRPQITTVLSILHRCTGIMLSLGSILFVIWLGAIAMGPKSYLTIFVWLTSPLGMTCLLGWAFCFYYHLTNGIRHLCWDMGWGYELKTMRRSGWTVILISMGLTGYTFWWMFIQ